MAVRHIYSGDQIPGSFLVGEDLTRGQLVYIDGTSGVKLHNAGNSKVPQAVVVGTVANGEYCELLTGTVVLEDADWSWTAGADLYAGSVNGELAASGEASYEIKIGHAITATKVVVYLPKAISANVDTGDIAADAITTVKILDSAVTPAKLEEQALSKVQIPLQRFLKNNLVTPLGTSGDGTNLGLVSGTHGTASPILNSIDVGGTNDSETARALIELPANYVAAGDVKLRFHAGMQVIADDVATLDVQAFETDEEAGIGSDLCTTGALSINSATLADKDFTIDGTGLVAGDILDVEITVAVTDAGNAADFILAIIGSCVLLYDRK